MTTIAAMTVLAAMLGGGAGAGGMAAAAEPHAGEKLLDAIEWVESRGDPTAVGDGGRSLGAYQVSRLYWIDGCRELGVDWDYKQLVTSRWHCRQIIRAVWRRYRAVTDEQRARLHNGGPNWRQKPRTAAYWADVRARMAAVAAERARSEGGR